MSVYSSSETGMSYLVKTILAYEKPCYFLLMTAVLLVLCIFFGKRKGRAVFFYPLVLLFATALNPYVFPPLFGGEMALMAQYYRMLWLILSSAICAFAMLSVAGAVKRKVAKLVVVVVFLLATVFMGTPLYSSLTEAQELTGEMYTMGEDRSMTDLIMEIEKDHKKDEPVILFENEELRNTLREYSASFTPVLYEKGKEDTGDYAIAMKNSDAAKAILKSGREICASCGDYVLFS